MDGSHGTSAFLETLEVSENAWIDLASCVPNKLDPATSVCKKFVTGLTDVVFEPHFYVPCTKCNKLVRVQQLKSKLTDLVNQLNGRDLQIPIKLISVLGDHLSGSASSCCCSYTFACMAVCEVVQRTIIMYAVATSSVAIIESVITAQAFSNEAQTWLTGVKVKVLAVIKALLGKMSEILEHNEFKQILGKLGGVSLDYDAFSRFSSPLTRLLNDLDDHLVMLTRELNRQNGQNNTLEPLHKLMKFFKKKCLGSFGDGQRGSCSTAVLQFGHLARRNDYLQRRQPVTCDFRLYLLCWLDNADRELLVANKFASDSSIDNIFGGAIRNLRTYLKNLQSRISNCRNNASMVQDLLNLSPFVLTCDMITLALFNALIAVQSNYSKGRRDGDGMQDAENRNVEIRNFVRQFETFTTWIELPTDDQLLSDAAKADHLKVCNKLIYDISDSSNHLSRKLKAISFAEVSGSFHGVAKQAAAVRKQMTTSTSRFRTTMILLFLIFGIFSFPGQQVLVSGYYICTTCLTFTCYEGLRRVSPADLNASARDDFLFSGVVNPEYHDNDIVFVHGLFGHWRDTWTTKNVFWPKDWLPTIKGKINQVWSYGYDNGGCNTLGCGLKDNLQGRAQTLLSRLHTADVGVSKPVIFVAHSMGGLMVKQALVLARDMDASNTCPYDSYCSALVKHVRGVVFLATPHRGSAVADALPDYLIFRGSYMSDSLLELQTSNKQTLDLVDRFASLRIPSVSFAEGTSMFPLVASTFIVTRDSALIGQQGTNNALYTIIRNHRSIAKLESTGELVFSELTRIIAQAGDTQVAPQYKPVNLPVVSITPIGVYNLGQSLSYVLVPTDISSKPRLVVITGMPGVGKSTVAITAAAKTLLATKDGDAAFQCVWYADVAATGSVSLALVSILYDVRLGKVPVNLRMQNALDIFRALSDMLTSFCSQSKWLILLDNVDRTAASEISSFLQSGITGGCLVITSIWSTFANALTVTVPPLSDADASSLLHLKTGPQDTCPPDLLRFLSGLPAAILTAAKLHVGCRDLYSRIQLHQDSFFENQPPPSLLQTFRRAVTVAEVDNPNTRDLLRMIRSASSPVGIVRSLTDLSDGWLSKDVLLLSFAQFLKRQDSSKQPLSLDAYIRQANIALSVLEEHSIAVVSNNIVYVPPVILASSLLPRPADEDDANHPCNPGLILELLTALREEFDNRYRFDAGSLRIYQRALETFIDDINAFYKNCKKQTVWQDLLAMLYFFRGILDTHSYHTPASAGKAGDQFQLAETTVLKGDQFGLLGDIYLHRAISSGLFGAWSNQADFSSRAIETLSQRTQSCNVLVKLGDAYVALATSYHALLRNSDADYTNKLAHGAYNNALGISLAAGASNNQCDQRRMRIYERKLFLDASDELWKQSPDTDAVQKLASALSIHLGADHPELSLVYDHLGVSQYVANDAESAVKSFAKSMQIKKVDFDSIEVSLLDYQMAIVDPSSPPSTKAGSMANALSRLTTFFTAGNGLIHPVVARFTMEVADAFAAAGDFIRVRDNCLSAKLICERAAIAGKGMPVCSTYDMVNIRLELSRAYFALQNWGLATKLLSDVDPYLNLLPKTQMQSTYNIVRRQVLSYDTFDQLPTLSKLGATLADLVQHATVKHQILSSKIEYDATKSYNMLNAALTSLNGLYRQAMTPEILYTMDDICAIRRYVDDVQSYLQCCEDAYRTWTTYSDTHPRYVCAFSAYIDALADVGKADDAVNRLDDWLRPPGRALSDAATPDVCRLELEMSRCNAYFAKKEVETARYCLQVTMNVLQKYDFAKLKIKGHILESLILKELSDASAPTVATTSLNKLQDYYGGTEHPDYKRTKLMLDPILSPTFLRRLFGRFY